MGVESEEESKKTYDSFAAGSLMGRIAGAEDIANLVSFLASEDARNITGSIMVSDSGTLLANSVVPGSISSDKGEK